MSGTFAQIFVMCSAAMLAPMLCHSIRKSTPNGIDIVGEWFALFSLLALWKFF